jgi:hypothetical protein
MHAPAYLTSGHNSNATHYPHSGGLHDKTVHFNPTPSTATDVPTNYCSFKGNSEGEAVIFIPNLASCFASWPQM